MSMTLHAKLTDRSDISGHAAIDTPAHFTSSYITEET